MNQTLPEVMDTQQLEAIIPIEAHETKITSDLNASGIQISKSLNLPNYDLTLDDIILMPRLVGIGRLQGRTTGALQPQNFSERDAGPVPRPPRKNAFSVNLIKSEEVGEHPDVNPAPVKTSQEPQPRRRIANISGISQINNMA